MTSTSTYDLMEALNRSCRCISVDRQRLAAELAEIEGALAASLAERQPHMFAANPVFVPRSHVEAMARLIGAIERVGALPAYQARILAERPAIAQVDHGPAGVFFGYDFHLGREGPRLIEVNTNAGGALLCVALARAQRACCDEVEVFVHGPHEVAALEEVFLEMFRREWRAQRGDAPLCRVAIVDEAPAEQYLYPEFLLAQRIFARAGIAAEIADPAALRVEGDALLLGDAPVDLVYNRVTDFYLDRQPALREAYLRGLALITPHPRCYGLLADKRDLIVLSDPDALAELGVDAETIATLAAGIPRTEAVTPARADALWARRDHLFFKPCTGYGSKAAYRGSKLTKKTWERIIEGGYVAQALVPPSSRTIEVDGAEVPLKLDVRAYAYRGAIQLLAARLYHGQTTNFRTPGGGFAPVYTEAASS